MFSSASRMSKGQDIDLVGLHHGNDSPSRSVKISSPGKPSLWKRAVIQCPKPLPKSRQSEAHKKSDVPKYDTTVVRVGNLVLISAHNADPEAAKEDDEIKKLKDTFSLLQKDVIDRKVKKLLKSTCRFEVIHCYSAPERNILQESHRKSFSDTKCADLKEESQQKSQDTNFHIQDVEVGHSRPRLLKKEKEVIRSKAAVMGQRSAISAEDREKTGRLRRTQQRTLSGERAPRPPLEGKPAIMTSKRRWSSAVRRDSWVSVDDGNTRATKKVNLGNILLEPYRNRQKPKVSMKEQQSRTANKLGVLNSIENVTEKEFTFDRKTAQIFEITKKSPAILKDNNIKICSNEKEIGLTGEGTKLGVSKLSKGQVFIPTSKMLATKINDREIESVRRNRRQPRMIKENGIEMPGDIGGESKMESRDFGIILEKLYRPKEWKFSAKEYNNFKAQNKRNSDHCGDLNYIKKSKKDPFPASDAFPGPIELKNKPRHSSGKAVQGPDKLEEKYFTQEPLQNTAYINSQIVKGSKVIGLLSEISRDFEEMSKDLSKPSLQRHKETNETYALSNRSLWNAEAMSGNGKGGELEKFIQETREINDNEERSTASNRTSREAKVSIAKWGTAKESDNSASETKLTADPPLRPQQSDRSSTRAELKKVNNTSYAIPITVKKNLSGKYLSTEDENLGATQTFVNTFARENITVYNEKSKKEGANFTGQKTSYGESKDDSHMSKELLGDIGQLGQLKKVQNFPRDKQTEIEGEPDYSVVKMENGDKGQNELWAFSSKMKCPNINKKHSPLPVVPVMVNGSPHVRDESKDDKKPSTEERVSKTGGGDGNTERKFENDNILQRNIDFRNTERWNSQNGLRQSGIEKVWWEEVKPQKVLADWSKQFIKPAGVILEGVGELNDKQENNKRKSGQSKSKDIFGSSGIYDSDEQSTDMTTVQTSDTLCNPEKYDADDLVGTEQEDKHYLYGEVLKKAILEPFQEGNMNSHRACHCQTNDNTVGSLRTNDNTMDSQRTYDSTVRKLRNLLKKMLRSVGEEVRTTEKDLLGFTEPIIPNEKEETLEQKRKREKISSRRKQKCNEKTKDVPGGYQKVSRTDKSKKLVDEIAKVSGHLEAEQKICDRCEKHILQQKAAGSSKYMEALRSLYDEKDMYYSKRLQMHEKHTVRKEERELDKHGIDAKMGKTLTEVEPKKDSVGRDIEKTKGMKKEKSATSVSKKTKEASTQTMTSIISAGVKGGKHREKKESAIPAVEKSKESVKHETVGKTDVPDDMKSFGDDKPKSTRSVLIQCEIIPYRNGSSKALVDGIIASREKYQRAQESLNETETAWRMTRKFGEAHGENLEKGQAQQEKEPEAEKSFKLPLGEDHIAESGKLVIRTESHSKLKASGARKKESVTKFHAMERATDVESDDLKWSSDFDELVSDLPTGSSYVDSISSKDVVIDGAVYSSKSPGELLRVVGVPTKYRRAGEDEDYSQQDKIPLLDKDTQADIVNSSIDNLLKPILNGVSTPSAQSKLQLGQGKTAHDDDIASRSSRRIERMSDRVSMDHGKRSTAENATKHMVDLSLDIQPESEWEKKSTHRLEKEKEETQSRKKADDIKDEKISEKGITELEKSSIREREDIRTGRDRESERDWYEKKDVIGDKQLSGVEISGPKVGHATDKGSKEIHDLADKEGIRGLSKKSDEQAEQIKAHGKAVSSSAKNVQEPGHIAGEWTQMQEPQVDQDVMGKRKKLIEETKAIKGEKSSLEWDQLATDSRRKSAGKFDHVKNDYGIKHEQMETESHSHGVYLPSHMGKNEALYGEKHGAETLGQVSHPGQDDKTPRGLDGRRLSPDQEDSQFVDVYGRRTLMEQDVTSRQKAGEKEKTTDKEKSRGSIVEDGRRKSMDKERKISVAEDGLRKLIDADRRKLVDDNGRGRHLDEDGIRKSMDKYGKISMDEDGRRKSMDKDEKITVGEDCRRKSMDKDEKISVDEDGRRKSIDKDEKITVDEDGRRKSLDKDERISVDEDGRRKLFDEDGRKLIVDDGRRRLVDEDGKRKSMDKGGKRTMDEGGRRKSMDMDRILPVDEDNVRKLFDEDGRKLVHDDGSGGSVYEDSRKFIDADARGLLDRDGRRKLLDEDKGKFIDEDGRKLIDENTRGLVDGKEKLPDEDDRRRPDDGIHRQFIDFEERRKFVDEDDRKRLDLVKEDGERKLVDRDGGRKSADKDGRRSVDEDGRRRSVDEDGRRRSVDEFKDRRRALVDEDGRRRSVDEFQDGRRRSVDEFQDGRKRSVEEDGKKGLIDEERKSIDEDGRRRRSVDKFEDERRGSVDDGRRRSGDEFKDGRTGLVDGDVRRRSVDEFEDGGRGLVDEYGRRRPVDEDGRRVLVDDGRRRSGDQFEDVKRGLVDEYGRRPVDEDGRRQWAYGYGRRRFVDEFEDGRRGLVNDGRRRSGDEFKDGRIGLVNEDGRRSVDEFEDGRRRLVDEYGRRRPVDEYGRRGLVDDGRRRLGDEFKDGRIALEDEDRRRRPLDEDGRRQLVCGYGKRKSVDEFEDGRRGLVDEYGRGRTVDEAGRRALADDGRRRSGNEFKEGRIGLVNEDGRRKSEDEDGKIRSVDRDGRRRSIDGNGRIKIEDEDGKRLSADEVGRKKLGDEDGGRRFVYEDGQSIDEDRRSRSTDEDNRGGLMNEDGRRKLIDEYGRPQLDSDGRQFIDSDGRRSSDKDGKRPLFEGIGHKLIDVDGRKVSLDEYCRILADAECRRRCTDEDRRRQSVIEGDKGGIIHDAQGFPGRFTKPSKRRSSEELEQLLVCPQDHGEGVKQPVLRSRGSSGEKKIKFYKFGPVAGGNYKKKQFAQPVRKERKGPWIRFYQLCKPNSMNNLCNWTQHASPTSKKILSNDYNADFCTLCIHRDES